MSDSNTAAMQCPIFQEMTVEERAEALPMFDHICYPAGASIIDEDGDLRILSIIVRGKCEVIKSNNGSKEQQLAMLDAGQIFGEMSFFDHAPHSATVRAVVDTEIMQLSRERFDQLAESGSTAVYQIALATTKLLAQRLRRMDQWTCQLVEQSSTSVEQRHEWVEFRSRLFTGWEF